MPKRKDTIDYQLPALDPDYSPFDDGALGRVISTTQLEARPDDPGAPKSILDRLNCAATWFRHDKGFSERPTPSTEMGHLKSIASALGKLELLLPIEWERNGFTGERDQPHVARGVERLLLDPLDELLRTVDDSAVADCIEIINDGDSRPVADELLLRLAAIVPLVQRAAKNAIASKAEPDVERGLVADREFTASLINIYADLFDRPPGLSRDAANNKPSGPLLRFVKACYAELEEHWDDEPLYGQIRTVLKER